VAASGGLEVSVQKPNYQEPQGIVSQKRTSFHESDIYFKIALYFDIATAFPQAAGLERRPRFSRQDSSQMAYFALEMVIELG
jgi:hypothetical protein